MAYRHAGFAVGAGRLYLQAMPNWFHAVPAADGTWSVTLDDAVVARGLASQAAAADTAQRLAREAAGEIVVHAPDGSIESTTVRPAIFGALRGQYYVREGIDLTRPIFEQV